MDNIKPLAFYLPQFHPIKENSEWWGPGFTEWTNVTKAKPLYKNHLQPKLPADLGFYDLRLAEIRNEQAKMAKNHGIHGFIYYHYWFGNGKMLLEKILEDVVKTKEPDFPFCICWANQTWTGIWHGVGNKILIEQKYPGEDDIRKHLEYLLPIFNDHRYIKIDGKPLFMVYDAFDFPDSQQIVSTYKRIAVEMGLNGMYFMASNLNQDDLDYKGSGYDGKVSNAFNKSFGTQIANRNIIVKAKSKFLKGKKPIIIDHVKLSNNIKFINSNVDTFPIVLPNWDNTPRSGSRGVVLQGSSPQLFEKDIKKSISFLETLKSKDKFLFIKSWNEWAEGNYLEPDRLTGFANLEIINKYFK